jgi:hypothetical protein
MSIRAPRHGRNLIAVETTIKALEIGERLTDIDAARVALVSARADAVDAGPTNASPWRGCRTVE